MRLRRLVVAVLGKRHIFGYAKWLSTGTPAICALFWISFSINSLAADLPPARNVLILNSFSERSSANNLDLLKATTRSHVTGPVNFQVEYLESERFETPGYEAGLAESLAVTYAGKVDLVIASSYPALRFAVDHREQIFPGAPIVFNAVATSRLEGLTLWPGVTGVTMDSDVHGTVELALRLHPDTTNVAIVSGTSEFERYWQKTIDQELQLNQSRLRSIDLVGMQPEALLRQVATLPPHTIIFFQLIPLESEQPVVGTYDILAAIAKQFPTYCIHNYCLDHGAVGGSYPYGSDQEVKAGELAGRILTGEKPESIPVMHSSAKRVLVDWRQLHRWNISETTLPAGSVVMYRQPTVFELYRKYIIFCALLIMVQTLLIISLLWQRARRRKTELWLHESEKRFRVMANTTPSLVWMCDKDDKVTYLNDRLVEFTGQDPTTALEDTWKTFIHPDDRQKVQAANSQGLEDKKVYSKEYRLRRRDGIYRWMLDVAAPRINDDGSFAGFIGSAIDITDQKLANEALKTISGKLIEAQENERSRIARELHDDICQRMALLSIQLGQGNLRLSESDLASPTRIQEIQRQCAQITRDIQGMSHQLHSSSLDYLGVESAIQGFCKEFSQQHNVTVDVTCENVPNPLPRDISLSLFRVTQEALHNAVKYSGVDRFTVDLKRTSADIQLEIQDAGAGFQMLGVKQNGGLGLVSMQERIHLVKGAFTVESKLNHGTKIRARIPFEPIM
jgi:PAS domain S-box-containing protein